MVLLLKQYIFLIIKGNCCSNPTHPLDRPLDRIVGYQWEVWVSRPMGAALRTEGHCHNGWPCNSLVPNLSSPTSSFLAFSSSPRACIIIGWALLFVMVTNMKQWKLKEHNLLVLLDNIYMHGLRLKLPHLCLHLLFHFSYCSDPFPHWLTFRAPMYSSPQCLSSSDTLCTYLFIITA